MRKHAFITLLVFFAAIAYGQTNNPARASEREVIKTRPLPLHSVRLTGGPLKRAQDANARYLLELEPDRMLALLRQSAGLQPKAKSYGGWEAPGRQLNGHFAGHYLSGVSLMYAATRDLRYKERVDYIVKELKEIQDAQKDGYIGAQRDGKNTDGKLLFQQLSKGEIRSQSFDLNGMWSPWYVEHKLFAGLRDAYQLTGNADALAVEVKFAGWVESILAPLDDQQIQRMLNTEFGGMNEVLAELYADTGDARWLRLSDKFEHRAMIDPLAAGQDILAGKHGNTQVPKMIGSLARYIYSGNQTDGKAAKFFWDEVALHHSFATGGHGKNEYFGPPDKLNDMIDGRTAESCNVYNMIKMARSLFSVEPDIRYADFHERALFNHILASQDADDGRVSYMVPVGRGVQHEYQDKFEDFTCCVGSSMESHALHAYGLYYESGNKLWVSLYAPTTVNWESAGVKLEMATNLPIGNSATLTVTPKTPKRFALALRRPYWAGAGFSVKVNGRAVKDVPGPDSFVVIERTWKAADKVELVLPKTLRKEPLADNPSRVAIMWGPLVLAGDLGPEVDWRAYRENGEDAPRPKRAPALVTTEQSVEKWLQPVAGQPGRFRTVGLGVETPIEFVPFYQLPRRRYAIYWDVITPDEAKRRSEAHAAEDAARKKLEAATVAFAQPGQMQAERDFNQQGEDSAPVQLMGRHGRQGAKWFSFDLPVDASRPMKLVITYTNDVPGRRGSCDVLVDGKKLGVQTIERRSPEQDIRFFDVEYALPAELVKDKQKVTVRFEATNGGVIPGVFGLRTVRAVE